ncbi:MAG: hypothetical protein SVM79_04540 [Chloroflexota bacterium]|nr:hypothetical protein [Chloroflexota bacterium]
MTSTTINSQAIVRGQFDMCMFCGGQCGGAGDALLLCGGGWVALLILKAKLEFHRLRNWRREHTDRSERRAWQMKSSD